MFFKPKGGNSTETDEALMTRFKASGDLEVLGRLYGKYLHLVYGVCLKYLGDREAAQDATMQIFEKLIVEIPKREIQNFKPWLHVTTKNHCLMQLRKVKAWNMQMEKAVKEERYVMENAGELHLNDEEILEHNLEVLRQCIENLKDEQKACVSMFYLQEKCYQEISDCLSVDLKKVKSYIQNGKRNLKICMENHGSQA
ncbi:MAG: sigma-70 family RNA polymerase sigma factor [Cyclobacteriaceae bacterium]|nr:sigma-70 family RNA polymerase sigma factor [Cyclobacteriaceae bacterium]